MMTVRELLLSTIEEKRPLVLLLGQDAWRDAKREDAILTAALEKLGRSRSAKRVWAATLSRKHVPPGYYGWLSERFERRVHPPFVELTALHFFRRPQSGRQFQRAWDSPTIP